MVDTIISLIPHSLPSGMEAMISLQEFLLNEQEAGTINVATDILLRGQEQENKLQRRAEALSIESYIVPNQRSAAHSTSARKKVMMVSDPAELKQVKQLVGECVTAGVDKMAKELRSEIAAAEQRQKESTEAVAKKVDTSFQNLMECMATQFQELKTQPPQFQRRQPPQPRQADCSPARAYVGAEALQRFPRFQS